MPLGAGEAYSKRIVVMSVYLSDLAGLYVAEQSRLGRLIHRIVRNRTTAEDLVHDAFVKLLRVNDANEIADPRAYVVRIARNLAIDHRRHERVLALEEDGETALFSFADPAPSPETILADREALAMTLAVIAAMPARTRAAFEMHRLDGRTLAEIGHALDISTSLAGKLVQDAYGLVRARLREQGDI